MSRKQYFSKLARYFTQASIGQNIRCSNKGQTLYFERSLTNPYGTRVSIKVADISTSNVRVLITMVPVYNDHCLEATAIGEDHTELCAELFRSNECFEYGSFELLYTNSKSARERVLCLSFRQRMLFAKADTSDVSTSVWFQVQKMCAELDYQREYLQAMVTDPEFIEVDEYTGFPLVR